MKRIHRVKQLLALFASALTCGAMLVSAAPQIDYEVEPPNAANIAEEKETVLSAKGILPGLNIITGTTEAYDVESGDPFSSNFLNVGNFLYSLFDSAEVKTSPFDQNGKAIALTHNGNGTTGTIYPQLQYKFWNDQFAADRPVHMTMKVAKTTTDTTKVATKSSLWLFASSTDGKAYPDVSIAHNGRFSYNPTDWTQVTTTQTAWGGRADCKIFQFVLQTEASRADTADTIVWFDDLSFVPYYRVSYYSTDGKTELGHEYVLLDTDGQLLSHFTPVAKTFEGETYSSWSLAPGGTAVDRVALANADLVLYASDNRVPSYDFHYFAVGNSYLSHGAFEGWQTTGNWGMAASAPDKDYFARLETYLSESYICEVQSERSNLSSLEKLCVSGATAETYKNAAAFQTLKASLTAAKPNLVTLQLSENIQNDSLSDLNIFYDTLYAMVSETLPEEAIVVCITPIYKGSKYTAIQTNAAKYGFLVADITAIGEAGDRFDNPYLAFTQYPSFSGSVDFRWHPGDKGHDTIAKAAFDQIKTSIQTLTPVYITVPESLSITGTDSITALGAAATFTASVLPAGASTKLAWKTSDPHIASIDENGVLTAVGNGQVTVTAQSVYDSSVTASKTVTVSGQAPFYTVTYAPGTDEPVTALPDADPYARGAFSLSEAVPKREGYTFVGWSKSENGAVVDEIEASENSTVYAVWKFADTWSFDIDGTNEKCFEGVRLEGFNQKVENGCASVISYESGLAISHEGLRVSTDSYRRFEVCMALGSSQKNASLAFTLSTAEKEYTYTVTVSNTSMHRYSIDLSGLSGTVTGFRIVPNAKSCAATIERIAFEKTSLDGSYATAIVTGNSTWDGNGQVVCIGTVQLSENAALSLQNGAFVVESIPQTASLTVQSDANFLVTGKQKPTGYVECTLGARADENHVRTVKIGDSTAPLIEYNNGYGTVISEKTMLTFTEKCSVQDITPVSVATFIASPEGSVSRLSDLDTSFLTSENVRVRENDPMGLRFFASLAHTARLSETVTVEEYGFVTTRASFLAPGEEVSLSTSRSAQGVAYSKADGVDKTYDESDEYRIFACTLVGIPHMYYDERMCVRPYMKLTAAEKEFTLYGESVCASLYETAKALLLESTLTDEERTLLSGIVASVEEKD